VNGLKLACTSLVPRAGSIKMNMINATSPSGRRFLMSIDIGQLDKRLTSVETALAEVRLKLGLVPASANWVEQVSGSLKDIPEDDYQEFLQCCRAVRDEDSAEDEEPHP
jgi:hypothetical protein